MKTLAFVPVRGGSKSIPLKNIKFFCGKPLVYWVLSELQQAKNIDEIYVATDSSEISSTVMQFNFSKVRLYPRDVENAQDTSSTESVMLEFLQKNIFPKESRFILVQATTPFLQAVHIDSALDKMANERADSLLTCVRRKVFTWTEDGKSTNYDYKQRPRRQDFGGILVENGAFYINTISNILASKNRLSGKITIFEMPEYSSAEIDEEDDWLIAEKLFEKHLLYKPNSLQGIKLFLTDVDGVLTDAGMYYSETGDELKKFNTRDGVGFRLLSERGVKTGIVTSENTKIVERRARKLNLDYCFQSVSNKLGIVNNLCTKLNISLQNVAYIGDDINDAELLKKVGIAACPSNAVSEIKDIPNIIQLSTKGGDGVVRDFVSLLGQLLIKL